MDFGYLRRVYGEVSSVKIKAKVKTSQLAIHFGIKGWQVRLEGSKNDLLNYGLSLAQQEAIKNGYNIFGSTRASHILRVLGGTFEKVFWFYDKD